MMNKFIINENNWHFKYLRKFNRNFRWAVECAMMGNPRSLPQNFCDYWKQISKLMIFHLSLIIATVIELKFVVFAATHFSYIINEKLFSLQPRYIRFETLLGLLGGILLSILAILFGLYYGIAFISWLSEKTHFVNFLDKCYLKLGKNKIEVSNKPDNIFNIWYKAKKEKYCPVISFDIKKEEN